jgi:hypothetical protein
MPMESTGDREGGTSTTGETGEPIPDEIEAEVGALRCALGRARSFWMSQKTMQQLVTDTSRYVDTYSRALHTVERREVSFHMTPAPPQRSAPVHPLPDARSLDPWSVDPAEIANASRVVSVCPTCVGAGTVVCGACAGTTRLSCRGCGGSGRVRGQKDSKNCGVCGGSGSRPCGACSNGRVQCTACAASGRVSAWLAVSQTRFPKVEVHPMGAGALVHTRVQSPEDFDAGSWVNTLTSDTRDEGPTGDLPRELRGNVDPRTDRVLSTRVQSFSSVVHRFTYGLAGMVGLIEVAGSPPAVSRSSKWRPLVVRQVGAAVVAVGVGIASVTFAGSYLERYASYQHGHPGFIAVSGVSAAVALGVVVAGLFLPRRLWSTRRVWAPLGLAVVAALVVGLVWRSDVLAAHQAEVSACNAAVSLVTSSAAKNTGETRWDDALRTYAEWKQNIESARKACATASMDSQVEAMNAADAEVDRQIAAAQEVGRQVKAEERRQAEAAQAAKKEKDAVDSFPARSTEIATLLKSAAMRATQAKWADSASDLDDAQKALDEFNGTSVGASKDWASLAAKVAEQRKRIQPQLDRIAEAQRQAALKAQLEEALRGDEIHARVAAEMAIKEAMNNPGSFDEVEQVAVPRGEFWVVTTKYRGTNAFGGIVTNTTTLCANKLTVGRCP